MTACVGSGADRDTAESLRPRGTIRAGLAQLGQLDPPRADGLSSLTLLRTACDGLIALNPQTGLPRPALAASWTLSQGAQRLTLRLRSKVLFQDGTPVTAEAIRESLSRVARPATSSPWSRLVSNVVGFPEVQSGAATHLSGVRLVSPSQLEIDLTQPFAELPTVLAHPALVPVSLKSLAAQPGGPDPPVCSGPYQIKAGAKEKAYRLIRGPVRAGPKSAYGGADGLAATIIVTGFDSPEDAFQAFKAGQVDLTPVPEGQISDVRDQKGFERAAGPQLTLLALDPSKAPTNNAKVRQAISLAIDRLVIIDAAFGDQRQPALGWLPETFEASSASSCEGFARKIADPARAKDLLAQSGVDPGSIKLPLIFDPGQFGRLVAQAIQVQLKDALGIQVEPEPLNAEDFAVSLKARSSAALWMTITDVDLPIPDELVGGLFRSGSPGNIVGFSDPEVDARIDRARKAVAPSDRSKLWTEAENAVCEQMPVIPMWRAPGQWVRNTQKASVGGDSMLDLFGGPILRQLIPGASRA